MPLEPRAYADLLGQIPVRLIFDGRTALLGAAHYAHQMHRQETKHEPDPTASRGGARSLSCPYEPLTPVAGRTCPGR